MSYNIYFYVSTRNTCNKIAYSIKHKIYRHFIRFARIHQKMRRWQRLFGSVRTDNSVQEIAPIPLVEIFKLKVLVVSRGATCKQMNIYIWGQIQITVVFMRLSKDGSYYVITLAGRHMQCLLNFLSIFQRIYLKLYEKVYYHKSLDNSDNQNFSPIIFGVMALWRFAKTVSAQ